MRAFLSLLLFHLLGDVQAQFWDTNFDNSFPEAGLNIQFVPDNENNIWQIGAPQKSNFSSAYSYANAMVTDTINTYPINNESYFIIPYVLEESSGIVCCNQPLHITFFFQTDCDSLYDHGIFDFSYDNGQFWIDPSIVLYSGNVPVLSGDSGGWQYADFLLDILQLTQFDVGDTILLRFGFISDEIETERDGLIYDDIIILDPWEDEVEEFRQSNLITRVFQDLASDLSICLTDPVSSSYLLEIFNASGQSILTQDNISAGSTTLASVCLISGCYIYTVTDKRLKNRTSSGKFIWK